jgi:hypothetical protein
MDDSPAEIGMPPAGREEALSDAHAAEEIKPEATIVESNQALTVPSNGSSWRKIEANRKNAKKSTGPKTSSGKATSSWNSMRHGILSKRLPSIYGQSKRRLLISLRRDLEPVGELEEVLVEKIAQDYWRLGVVAWHDAEAFTKQNPFTRSFLPTISRYQTTINRQLFQTMNQLERLQRLRKGDNVPAPLNLEILGEPPIVLENRDSDR